MKRSQKRDARIARGLVGLVLSAGLACGAPDVAPQPSAPESGPLQKPELPPIAALPPLERPVIAREELAPMALPGVALELPHPPNPPAAVGPAAAGEGSRISGGPLLAAIARQGGACDAVLEQTEVAEGEIEVLCASGHRYAIREVSGALSTAPR